MRGEVGMRGNIVLSVKKSPHQTNLLFRMLKIKWLYLMLLPGMIYFILYKYLPMWGLVIAFVDYHPFLGVMHSPWVGMKNFNAFFSDPNFWMLMRNTFLLACYNLFFFFPIPIIISILLNEIRREFFKQIMQTM